MDRRNGDSNVLAPPRPPKTIPRVHRPRAPDPDTVDSPSSIHIISTHPSHSPPATPSSIPAISRMNSNTINNNHSNSCSISSSSTNSHRSIPSLPPPVTAPLTPLQNNHNINNNDNNNNNFNDSRTNIAGSGITSTVSTFSRRRIDMPLPTTQQQQQQQRVPSTNVNSSVTRSQTPSSLVTPTANLISNAISAVIPHRRSPSPVNNTVTLQIPRPENERLPNEYVDTPFAQPNNKPGSRHSLATSTVPNRNSNQFNGGHHHHTNISIIDGTSVLQNNNNINIINSNNKSTNLPNRTGATTIQRPNMLPITKQPSFRNNNTLQKQKDAGGVLHQQFSHCPEDNSIFANAQNASNNNGLIIPSDQLNSITCPQCNRCRCEECQRPRQLPYKWICNDNFLCSAETIIDYASCLCCVKGLYYHCAKDHEIDCDSDTIRCAEDPCSCAPYKRASRWGCLSALSLLLPCLLCYWPMRGCVSLCAKCYAKHSRHGCRCNNNLSSANNSRLNIINLASSPGQDQLPVHHYHRRSNNNDLTPEKRLLDSTNNEY